MFLKKKNDYELFFDNIIQLKFNLPPSMIDGELMCLEVEVRRK